jgi:hypothetical protein
MLAYYRLSTTGGYGTEITRAIDNRPMSFRSQALFRSNTEVKHVLRQLDPALRSFPDLRWWKIPLAWLAGISLGWERRYQCGQLFDLDDRLLADIGLSRTAVEEVRGSRLYLAGCRDSRPRKLHFWRRLHREVLQTGQSRRTYLMALRPTRQLFAVRIQKGVLHMTPQRALAREVAKVLSGGLPPQLLQVPSTTKRLLNDVSRATPHRFTLVALPIP